jgi:hypothetical protein
LIAEREECVSDESHIDDELHVVRSPQEVARRALAVIWTYALAFDADRDDLDELLDRSGLRASLAPSEARLFAKSALSEQENINLTWTSERLIVLLWALGQVEELPPPDEQCGTDVFYDLLPPFADITIAEFIENACLRPDSELIAMADRILNLNWAARDGRLNNRPPREPVDGGVIQERHHAINWIVGYSADDWDDVETDT